MTRNDVLVKIISSVPPSNHSLIPGPRQGLFSRLFEPVYHNILYSDNLQYRGKEEKNKLFIYHFFFFSSLIFMGLRWEGIFY